MRTAADIMTSALVTVGPDTPVREVAEVLAANRFGSAPVVDEAGQVLGVVTEEDMVRRAAEIHLPRHLFFLDSIIYLEDPRQFQLEAENILAARASAIMDTVYAIAEPDEPVEEVAARMLREDLRRMLVLADDGRLLGIVTRADIVRMYARAEPPADEQAA